MTDKTLDTYLDLCTQVYDLSKPNPPKDAYDFYRQYAQQANGPILEPMCGTGRFLLPLFEEGFDVHGFDASECMLKALHAKASFKNINPTIWQGFVEDLRRPEKYELIFIPGGSFCLMLEPEAVKAALQSFYDHLANDGVLVLEIITMKWKNPQPKVWTGDVWYREDGKSIIMSSFTKPDVNNVRHSIGKYELADGAKIMQTEIEDFKVRLYDEEIFSQMLTDAGFKDIRILKCFDSSAIAGENDEEIIFECRKA